MNLPRELIGDAEICKTFEPPSAEECLRFRYTTYMGEHHPAEKKVVLEFCPADMPDLTPLQLDKLKKLCGVRYNPETDIVKMSSEMFPSQAQNKRYLGDRVDILLKEARVCFRSPLLTLSRKANGRKIGPNRHLRGCTFGHTPPPLQAQAQTSRSLEADTEAQRGAAEVSRGELEGRSGAVDDGYAGGWT